MPVDIRPLGDALGAEVQGIDFTRDLASEDAVALRTAFLNYHLLCLRSDPLSPEAFAAVSRTFGEPKLHVLRNRRHETVPEVAFMDSTYAHAGDKPVDFSLDRKSAWHTDDSYFEVPAKISLLQSIAIPDSGGQTRFANTRKAFEDLSDLEKQKIDGLQAVHSYDTERAPARAAKRTQEEEAETPDVVHPLARTHEDSGAKAIYFNPNRTDRIVDMQREESTALLDWIHGTVTQKRYQYAHEWRVGDILIWDNRCLLHSVNMDFPIGQKRLHQRILIEGDKAGKEAGSRE